MNSGLQPSHICWKKKRVLLHKVLLIISSQLTFSTSSMLEMFVEPFARGKHALAAAMRVTYKTRVGLGFQHWKSCSIPNSEFYTPLIIIIQSSFIYTLKWKQACLVSVHKVAVAIRPVSRTQFYRCHKLKDDQGPKLQVTISILCHKI